MFDCIVLSAQNDVCAVWHYKVTTSLSELTLKVEGVHITADIWNNLEAQQLKVVSYAGLKSTAHKQ